MADSSTLSRRSVLQTGAAALAMPASQVGAQVKTLRIGLVGVGGRGTDLLRQIVRMDNITVPAIADIDEARLANAQKLVTDAKLPRPEGYSRGERDFERLCDRSDLDLVINATPWQWHTPISLAAMKAGKHAATEVPAALTIDQCWELVETSEKTGKHCMMLENDCYYPETLMALNMLRAGLLGEPLFAEGGYMHDLRGVKFGADKNGPLGNAEPWRLEYTLKNNGNLYPTHPIGPISWWFDINRGDRYTSIVSMSSRAGAMREYAEREFGKDDWRAKADYHQGDVNTSILRTAQGRLVHLYFDTNTPRVKEAVTRLQCSKGVYSLMLNKIFIDGRSFRGDSENWRAHDEWEDIDAYKEKYQHKLWRERGRAAVGASHGGIDYMLIYRLVKRLQAGLAPDMDVYDAAVWSAIVPLSIQSVASRSRSLEFPDFTRGRWRDRPGINPDEID
ncbi:MAG: Gfo/Idh/MocA family oxidoreductase [Bryobacterales bacterium]|nr:Gfo/Idh/MocA family oxidoreductase [Bryobacterales bacterium]